MSISEIKKSARDAGNGSWGILIAIAIIFTLLKSMAGYMLFASLFLSGPLKVGVRYAYLNKIKGRNVELDNLFYGFNNFVKTMVLGIINSLLFIAWSLLFVIPGIIKFLSYSMSYYIIAENPTIEPNEARLKSMSMMVGHKARLFCLYLSFTGWFILSIFTFGLLLLWVIPYMNLSVAAFYEDLKRRNGIIDEPQSTEEVNNEFDAEEFLKRMQAQNVNNSNSEPEEETHEESNDDSDSENGKNDF